MVHFSDRAQAGVRLAQLLKEYQNKPNVLVLGLARGGVATAVAVAKELNLPVDVMVVRKLGAQDQEELAIGALAQDDVQVLNMRLIEQLGIPERYVKDLIEKKRQEVNERIKIYRAAYPALPIKSKTVILVDDGIATGATMEVAIKAARKAQAHQVIVAVPVLAADVVPNLKKLADTLVFIEAPEDFYGIGQFYSDFKQLNHEDVINLLTKT